MKKKILTLTIGLAALALAGCDTTGNTNTANTNTRNANSNIYVVNNNGNTTAVQTTNSNRWTNANNVNRSDYDKNRAEYERDKRSTETIGSGANDSWIWFKTRAALMTTDDLRESTIDVDVENAAVTLKGTVENAAQKTKAEQTAKGIEGVTKVTNQLKVAPNDSMTNTDDADDKKNSNKK